MLLIRAFIHAGINGCLSQVLRNWVEFLREIDFFHWSIVFFLFNWMLSSIFVRLCIEAYKSVSLLSDRVEILKDNEIHEWIMYFFNHCISWSLLWVYFIILCLISIQIRSPSIPHNFFIVLLSPIWVSSECTLFSRNLFRIGIVWSTVCDPYFISCNESFVVIHWALICEQVWSFTENYI